MTPTTSHSNAAEVAQITEWRARNPRTGPNANNAAKQKSAFRSAMEADVS
jgi:hypothetical protein